MYSIAAPKTTLIKRALAWPYVPFIVLGIIVFLFHLPMKAGSSDDYVFIQTFGAPGFDPIAYSLARYMEWTSRTLLEFLLMLGISIPVMLWKIADTFVFVLIGVLLSKIIVRQRRFETNVVICSLMLLFPYADLSSAGWVTTTVTYTWPLLFALCAIYPLRKIADGSKIRGYEYVFYAVSLLIGANNEQLCFVLLAVYISFTAYMFVKKRINAFVLVQLVLGLLSLAYIMFCPGNAARAAAEAARWFPDYQSFSFLQKLESGVSVCLSALFLSNNWLFLVLTFFVFYLARKKYRSVFYRLTAAIPSLFTAALSALSLFKNNDVRLGAIFNMAGPYGILNSRTIDSLFYIFAMFCMAFIVCMLLVSIYTLSDKSRGSLKVTGIVIVGIATKVVIGFSPSVWAALNRTGVYLMFSLIAGSVYLLGWWDFNNKSASHAMLTAAVLLGVFFGVMNFFTLA